jgi:DNA-binding transcriptional regulator YbjK
MARTARGARRRAALLDAAAALLEEEGFAAVHHRAVAARAGLPLAATTYYFASLAELLEEALRRAGEPYLAEARSLVETLPDRPAAPARLAATIVAIVTGGQRGRDPARLLTFYERYLQAGRQPRLRPIVAGWTAELVELVGEALRRGGRRHDPPLARQLVATVDGLLLSALVEGDPDPQAAATAGLTGLLAALPA